MAVSKDPLKSVAQTIQTIASGKTGIKTVDKQKKKDALLTKNLKKLAKRTKVKAKPQKFDITPKSNSAFSIQKETITMAKDGGLMEAIEKVKKEDAVKMENGGEALSSPVFQGKSFGKKTADINTPTGRRMIQQIRKIMPDASRDEIIKFGLNAGVLKKEKGGEVPAKFKGFSKLPEDVQEQMNPTLAKKFEKGGVVKMGKGGGVCKGMGIARAGGKFKIR